MAFAPRGTIAPGGQVEGANACVESLPAWQSDDLTRTTSIVEHTPAQPHQLPHIVTRRYRRGSVMLTSNLALGEWHYTLVRLVNARNARELWVF